VKLTRPANGHNVSVVRAPASPAPVTGKRLALLVDLPERKV
jgi:hypothetical protein